MNRRFFIKFKNEIECDEFLEDLCRKNGVDLCNDILSCYDSKPLHTGKDFAVEKRLHKLPGKLYLVEVVHIQFDSEYIQEQVITSNKTDFKNFEKLKNLED